MEGSLHRTETAFFFFFLNYLLHFFFSPADLKAIPEGHKIRSSQIFTLCMKQPQSFPCLGTVCSLTGPRPYFTPTPLLSQPHSPKLCTSFEAALQKFVRKATTWSTPQKYSQSRSMHSRKLSISLCVTTHHHTTLLWH